MHNLLVIAGACACVRDHKRSNKAGKPGRSLRARTRKSMFRIHEELGEGLFRRAFRMHFETFLRLYNSIKIELFGVLNYNSWQKILFSRAVNQFDLKTVINIGVATFTIATFS